MTAFPKPSAGWRGQNTFVSQPSSSSATPPIVGGTAVATSKAKSVQALRATMFPLVQTAALVKMVHKQRRPRPTSHKDQRLHLQRQRSPCHQ
eukprot:3905783-Amphidinium_carterae.2